MALSREQKESILTSLSSVIGDAATIVFIRFNGVSVGEIDTVRSCCAEEGIGYMVAKKTLIRRAFAAAGVSGEFPALEGEVALAYGTDTLAPAQVIGKCASDLKDRLSIIGGVFEGSFASEEHMRSIAAIPPLKTLYAQFLMVLQSPTQQFASVLDQRAKQIA